MCSYNSHSLPATTSHWCNLVQFSSLYSVHQLHIHQLDSLQEPYTYKEVAAHSHWIQAMQAKIAALKANETWVVGLRYLYLLEKKLSGLNGFLRSSLRLMDL